MAINHNLFYFMLFFFLLNPKPPNQIIQPVGLIGQFFGNRGAFLGGGGVGLHYRGYFADSLVYGSDHFSLPDAGQRDLIHQCFDRLDTVVDGLHG